MYQNKDGIYLEKRGQGNAFREEYLTGLDRLIDSLRQESKDTRYKFGLEIENNREEKRAEFREMLGWPLSCEAQPIISVKEVPVYEDEKCVFTRMQFEIFKDFRFYGILFRHKSESPLPFSVVQHGGSGTPEICSSFYDSANYNDMTMRLFKKGINVFAPQMLLWDNEEDGTVPDRRNYNDKLLHLGSSIAALEIYCLLRVFDYFEKQPFCDGNLGMAGMSYGGFYTLYTAACDTRIKAALASSHFNDRVKYMYPDKVWKNSANTFLDAQIGALVCPRPLCIQVGNSDGLFGYRDACDEAEILKQYYSRQPENFVFGVFDGEHEFCPTEEPLDWFIEKLKA